MSYSEAQMLTKSELLEMERICDHFEADQKLSATALEIDGYSELVDPSIRALVRLELERIKAEWSNDLLTNRVADSTHSQTLRTRNAAGVLSPSLLQSRLGQRFQFLDFLGQGSSGSVWKAFDQKLNRIVAIKLPHSDLPSHTDHFVREARAASRLNHPNIATILEVGHESDYCFLLCELIEGGSLADRFIQKQYSISESVDLLIDVASAMEYAHSMGIVHRDLKPQNILVGDDGAVKIVDFGLAKDANDHDATLTQTGAMIGTPAYMSPEQANGSKDKSEATSDIYSFGVIFFQLLTGDVPFRGNPQIVLFQLLHADPPPPIRLDKGIPPELNTLCLKCLEKKAVHRFQTAKELKEELIRYRNGHPIQSKPATFVFVARKWIGRNRRLSGWIAATCLLLLTTTVVASVSALVIGRSWRSERALRVESQNSADAILVVLRLFESMMQSSDPVNSLLMGGAVAKVQPPISELQLDAVTERLKREMVQQPILRARLLDVIANVYRALGNMSAAQSLLEEASTTREKLETTGLASDIPSHDYWQSDFYRGWLEHDRSNWQSAEKFYRKVLAGTEADVSRENQLFRGDVFFQLGRLLIDAGQANEAKPFMQDCVRIRRSLLPDDAAPLKAAEIGLMLSTNDGIDKIPWMEMLSIFDGNDWAAKIGLDYAVCVLNRNAKNYTQASVGYAMIHEQLRKSLPANHPISLFALGDYAGFLVESGDYRKAEVVANDLFELGDKVCPTHRKLVAAKSNYAVELMFAFNFEKASRLFEEVLVQHRATDRFPYDCHYGLAWCNLALKKPQLALEHAKALWEHRENRTASQVAWCAHTYARALQECGQLEDAKIMDERALAEAVIERHFPTDGIGLERMSIIHSHHGDLAIAEKLLREAVSAERRDRPANHPRIADRLVSLSEVLVKQNKVEEARELLNESLDIRRLSLPSRDRRIGENIRLLNTLTEVP